MQHKEWTLLLGRFQVPTPHKGHRMLINTLLDEGKNVLIGLRKEDDTEKNPYTIKQRKMAFTKAYRKEIEQGRVKVIGIPDVVEVAYGRTPGWNIYEIEVPEHIKQISATEIRKNKNE